ncbi:hypothetical protein [Aliiruegeria sabulilitoris]|uniref:hypothetical protein n=1 Tax=Aliiruegeria sabulilitoris TaxID=1510458 RepID=UPI00083042E1|nr:hypothetical protein [Aliiruegeria sabulilitoris]NDR56304.1 hypothetical protein [Pseudoruegeria sp. M32A2M]
MKKDLDFRQDRGSWFASVDGFERKLGVHATDRLDRRQNAVRLFTDDPDDDTRMRERQLESARRDGAIALRHYNAATNTAAAKVGVFGGEVCMVDGKPWFLIQRRFSK